MNTTLQMRIEELMAAKGWTTDSEVAAVAGVSRSAVAQWRGKGSKDIKTVDLEPAMRLEAATGFAALWISRGEGPKLVGARGMAHAVSDLSTNLPLFAEWERIMSTATLPELPGDFLIKMPDGALHPNIPAGATLWFKRASDADIDDVVIVQVGHKRFVRVLRVKNGKVIAAVTDDNYRDFDVFTVAAKMFLRPGSKL